MLRNGINVCYYGIGSHFNTLNLLASRFIDSIIVTVKGFNTGIFMDNILVKILQSIEKFGDKDLMKQTEDILNRKKPETKATVDQIIKLLETLNKFEEELVIVFHNIDGKHFREHEQHEILSRLAAHRSVSPI